ncbi:MAG: glycosyltransferase family 2 protein [Rhodobacterales bacterium]|nr:glycosyltransferase family 2 protein [Rhodobacterales bacterium]
MKIYVHIGLEQVGAARLQDVLASKRDQLINKGVLFSRAAGPKNHTRLFMAVTDPDHIDPLRYNRGYITEDKQRVLRETLAEDLAKEVATHTPKILILSASQLGSSLARKSEINRLRDLLLPLSDDIEIIAHVDEQSALLARHYGEQIMEGRAHSLDLELELADSGDWWDDALLDAHVIDPQIGQFLETQTPPFWLDYTRLVTHWEDVFGAGHMHLRPYDETLFYAPDVTDELRAAFGIKAAIGKAVTATPPTPPSAAWLARARLLNALLLKVLAKRDYILPRQLWRKFINEIRVEGDSIDVSTLAPVAKSFAEDNKVLVKNHAALKSANFKFPRAKKPWQEADPERGFRANQYLLAFLWRIEQATKEERKTKAADLARLNDQSAPAPKRVENADVAETALSANGLTAIAEKVLPPLAKQNFEKLRTSSFAPHNKMGAVNEEELAAAYSEIKPRKLPKGNSGNVIVGCMKNEAPYILEWVAYHRAMGIDNFLIYTNDCTDGTSEILDRLQEIGVLQHRNNDKWKGNSPQQYALNCALKEDLIKDAELILHIDVDEFVNVRTGNGTMDDFFAALKKTTPDATNVAMTWRLFGHNGVTDLADEFVIDQFDTCAPKFCPKPHTVWGFKTMFKNIGAYEKISCHRPNKLRDNFTNKVKWANGSGRDMGGEVKNNGWRNSKKSIGYDLIQLNHYALRSAESFLIKRQRGRALHVDRSIGLNYWIRMDWSNFKDITIKRNSPRLRAEYDRLLADKTLAKWHRSGLLWHRAKADELHDMPEFQDLYDQALKVKLTETERVAYALALDMES